MCVCMYVCIYVDIDLIYIDASTYRAANGVTGDSRASDFTSC